MKKLIYKMMHEVNFGTEETPDIRQILNTVEQRCTDEEYVGLYEKAAAEAHGEITVEDIPDPVTEPTLDERNRADIDYIALMTGIEL